MVEEIKKISVDGVEYAIVCENVTKITYLELKTLRDNSQLIAGHLYRITDYEFTTAQTETKSAGNVFDIIVLATAENQLSELARAIQHEGDTYFDGNDLGAWELWYDLVNDIIKYGWADTENGKGVIYRMIDENRNDCPYDFKNALFYNTELTSSTTTDKYYYTFSYVEYGNLYDATVIRSIFGSRDNCMGECIGSSKARRLNGNLIIGDACTGNIFGLNCKNNILLDGSNDKFGSNCYDNYFENSCYNNTFGSYCRKNKFGMSCHNNTFGNDCVNNIFGGYSQKNTFRNDCHNNTFGSYCVNNSFGNDCKGNSFGYYCINNTLGGSCYSNTFDNQCRFNTFGDNCSNNHFGYNATNREVNSEKTAITHNDEYFDDGSGQLVPIKHPDLSTQPSILPYKFMGQYVYEQLLPMSVVYVDAKKVTIYLNGVGNRLEDLIPNYSDNISILSLNIIAEVEIDGKKSLRMMPILDVAYMRGDISRYDCSGLVITIPNPSYGHYITKAGYVKIVYTFYIPEEGGYYGYNNY